MSLLENWRNSATRRAEFAAILQEPVMQEAIAIVKEAIFTPISVPHGLNPADRMAFLGEMGLRREMGLEFLHKFVGLANISELKKHAQELQKRKPWETADKATGEKKILDEFYSGSPPPLVGATGPTGATGPVLQTSETTNPPPSE